MIIRVCVKWGGHISWNYLVSSGARAHLSRLTRRQVVFTHGVINDDHDEGSLMFTLQLAPSIGSAVPRIFAN